MKIKVVFLALLSPLLLTSCATPPPLQTYHSTDPDALVVESMNNDKCQIVQPVRSRQTSSDLMLVTARTLRIHRTAIVILEDYTEMQPGPQFSDRSTPWIVKLRSIGFEHIVFLKGDASAQLEGKLTLADYE